MSHSNATHHDEHGHDDHDDGLHITTKGYVIGFLASVVLTAIPFWLVMNKMLPSGMTAFVILAFAAVQMVVHVVYFLHLSPKSEGGWNMLAFIFTIVLVVIMLAGSLWVMHHLNVNMMPMNTHDMRNMP